jgi:hypothetical protein
LQGSVQSSCHQPSYFSVRWRGDAQWPVRVSIPTPHSRWKSKALLASCCKAVWTEPRSCVPTPSSRAQKWYINNVFLPEDGLAGYTIVNVETTGALKFNGVKKPLIMGASRPPVELEVLWLLIAPAQGVFWHCTSAANAGQAIDSYGLEEGSVAGAFDSDDGNERQLFRLRKAAV